MKPLTQGRELKCEGTVGSWNRCEAPYAGARIEIGKTMEEYATRLEAPYAGA